MAGKDYYKILGVHRDSTDEEIKKAYRRLALEHHPDKFKGDKKAEEHFKEINAAYEVLKDAEKRRHYDMFGEERKGRPFTETGFGGDFQDFFGDIFSDFFGQRRPSAAQRGEDLTYEMEISFEESIFGASKKINIPRKITCPVCSGARTRPGTSPLICQTCRGTGNERFVQGFFSISRTCSTCRGQGRIIQTPCEECRGMGFVETARTLTVNIPAGVDTGTRLRITGEGNAGWSGGGPGDLYIFLTASPHPIFTRENNDIICEVPISFPQATLGAEFDIPTLEGPVKLKIPPGTQTGKVFRLKGKGAHSPRTAKRGDQLVVVKIETPSRLTKKQRELLEEFTKECNEETTPQKKTFFDKVKEIFG